ncbi:MAG: hypothetical protein ACYC3F_16725 [Gemmatimonadaceae bacterium]
MMIMMMPTYSGGGGRLGKAFALFCIHMCVTAMLFVIIFLSVANTRVYINDQCRICSEREIKEEDLGLANYDCKNRPYQPQSTCDKVDRDNEIAIILAGTIPVAQFVLTWIIYGIVKAILKCRAKTNPVQQV